MQIFDIVGPSSKNENDSLFPSLTYRERLIGFAFCFIMGIWQPYLRLLHPVLVPGVTHRLARRKPHQVCCHLLAW